MGHLFCSYGATTFITVREQELIYYNNKLCKSNEKIVTVDIKISL